MSEELTFFVGIRSGDAANDLIYNGGGIDWLAVAESVHGDGGLALFDGSLGGAKVFLKGCPGLVGIGEVLPYADVVGEDWSAH